MTVNREPEVLIIGGGVNGLGLAYLLAKEGLRDVVVLERRYIPYGASGRNGGGVRAQWGSADNVALARESIKVWERLSAELGFNIWFRQGGYLFLAYDDQQAAALERNVALHKGVAVPSRLVAADEMSVLAPDLNADGVVAASYSPTDGVLFPWSVVFAYWQKLKDLGVPVLTYTGVTDLEVAGGRVTRVGTTRGDFCPKWVVNAAGAWSRELSAMAGVDMPNKPVRHEIMVTEALKPFLDPMVVDMRTGLYVNQDMRGEIVTGVGHDDEPEGINFASTFRFAKDLARNLLDLFPVLGDVTMMRQWAGAYDVTPDNKPVLGASPGVENLVQLNGASGHGFMVSPMTTRLTADLLLGRKPVMDVAPYLLDRFENGDVQADAMIIG